MRSPRAVFSVLRAGLVCFGLSPVAHASEAPAVFEHADNDLTNERSLQRGAKYFVNYCLGCHSAEYVRYESLVEDLGLTEDQLVRNLMFAGGKPQDTMETSMRPEDAVHWFGRKPPDLSLAARSRGTDWLFSYLKSFYVDPDGSQGVNNLMTPGLSMPHVLWEQQGVQRVVFAEEVDADGNAREIFDHFEQVTEGALSAEEYDALVRDLVNFLDYIGEPAQLERQQIGLRVLTFLAFLLLLTYALKREFWKDVH